MTYPGSSCWRSPSARPILDEAAVHVWRASLEAPEGAFEALHEVLSEDERVRAARFASEELQRRFIVRRGILRTLLASYLEASPRDLRFEYGPEDKPSLAGDPVWKALRFNLSHSYGKALFAVAREREIGVDLEKIRDEVEHDEIAQGYFAPLEAAALAEAPLESRAPLFFTYWTCKEAWIKAKGRGLTLPLDRFEIRLVHGESSARVIDLEDPNHDSHGYVHQLDAAPGFAAALAVDDPDLGFSLWNWKPTGPVGPRVDP
jgi:4'-phosphopantetheinyl transferase